MDKGQGKMSNIDSIQYLINKALKSAPVLSEEEKIRQDILFKSVNDYMMYGVSPKETKE
jgi:hypothetical protein